MKKSLCCLCSIMLVSFLQYGDLNAGDSKVTPFSQLFNDDTASALKLADSAKNMKKICSTVRGNCTSAESQLKKLTTNTKTYSRDTDVALALFLNGVLSCVAQYCDGISSAYGFIADGISSIKSSKSKGDKKYVEGRNLLEQGIRTLESSAAFLALFRSGIILLSQLSSTREGEISNVGEIKKSLETLKTSIGDRKKLIGSAKGINTTMSSFKENYMTIKDDIKNDKVLDKLFKVGELYIADSKSIFTLLSDFLDALIALLEGDNGMLESLSKQCDQDLRLESKRISEEENEDEDVLSTSSKKNPSSSSLSRTSSSKSINRTSSSKSVSRASSSPSLSRSSSSQSLKRTKSTNLRTREESDED